MGRLISGTGGFETKYWSDVRLADLARKLGGEPAAVHSLALEVLDGRGGDDVFLDALPASFRLPPHWQRYPPALTPYRHFIEVVHAVRPLVPAIRAHLGTLENPVTMLALRVWDACRLTEEQLPAMLAYANGKLPARLRLSGEELLDLERVDAAGSALAHKGLDGHARVLLIASHMRQHRLDVFEAQSFECADYQPLWSVDDDCEGALQTLRALWQCAMSAEGVELFVRRAMEAPDLIDALLSEAKPTRYNGSSLSLQFPSLRSTPLLRHAFWSLFDAAPEGAAARRIIEAATSLSVLPEADPEHAFDLSLLQKLARLSKLHIGGKGNVRGWATIGERITELSLYDRELDPGTLDHLPNLQTISFRRCAIAPSLWAALDRHPRLQQVAVQPKPKKREVPASLAPRLAAKPG